MIGVVFFLILAVFIATSLLEHRKSRFEISLMKCTDQIVSDLRKGILLRSSIVKHAKEKGPAAALLRKVVERSTKTSFVEALNFYQPKYESSLWLCFCRIIRCHEETKLAITNDLSDLVSDFKNLDETRTKFLDENLLGARMIQIVAVFGIPTLVLFLQEIQEIEVRSMTLYFMGFVAVLYSLFDYLIFSNWKRVIITLPLLVTGYIFVVTKLATAVAQMFANLFV